MNLQHQIKLHRTSMGLSQDELAEKIFVSRQTISNWETGKSYPDVHSLILMGNFFNISLDELIKGDLEIMKNEIDNMEVKYFNLLSNIFGVMLLLVLIAPFPLVHYMGWVGIVITVILAAATLPIALKIEKIKKEHNIQTYREISDFMAGRKLDKIVEERDKKQMRFENILKVTISAAIPLVIGFFFYCLLFK